MWSIHPTNCENVVIRNLTIRSTGGNGDGIDIDSWKHVRIDGCDISTGDDCISIKSGRGMEAYTLLQTSEDILITNCTMADSIFACIGIGSETSGGIRNVRIEHCKFTDARTFAIYIKSRPGPRRVHRRHHRRRTWTWPARPAVFCASISSTAAFRTSRRFRATRASQPSGTSVLERAREGLPGPGGWHGHPSATSRWTAFRWSTCAARAPKALRSPTSRMPGSIASSVTGFAGLLLGIHNVTGKGLQGAAAIDGPKVPGPIAAPAEPYRLR